jgi:hypothetical protein
MILTYQRMDTSVTNCRILIRTTKNGVQYFIYRQEALADISDSFITFSISTIECARRKSLKYPHVLSRTPTQDGYECIQIVADRDSFHTTKFLCWAESQDLITGTAIVPLGSYMFPYFLADIYGNFLDDIKGTLLFNISATIPIINFKFRLLRFLAIQKHS